ncbi:MAG: phosphatase PAP2 family protein, partial [Pseudomonadota bacterium]
GYSIASFLIITVACSRIFLDVHWLSDILGGILLGWISLLIMALFYQRHPSQNIHPEKMLPCIVVLQIVLTWGYLYTHHAKRILFNTHHAYHNSKHLVEKWRAHFDASDQSLRTYKRIPEHSMGRQ